MVRGALITATAALALMAPEAAQACRNAGAVPPELTAESARQSVRCLINKKRKRKRARPLRANSRLELAAQEHSAAMDAEDFFSHTSLDGSNPLTRIKAAGYLVGAAKWAVGENLSWAEGNGATPKSTVAQWMASPSHRAAMLSRRYRHVGIGVVFGSPMGSNANSAIYTADFGFRK